MALFVKSCHLYWYVKEGISYLWRESNFMKEILVLPRSNLRRRWISTLVKSVCEAPKFLFLAPTSPPPPPPRRLCTRIWVFVMIGLLKIPFSICQSRWKETRNALPVIRWVRCGSSQRTADAFPVVASLPPKIAIFRRERGRLPRSLSNSKRHVCFFEFPRDVIGWKYRCKNQKCACATRCS